MALSAVQSIVTAGMVPNPPSNIGTAIGVAAALDNSTSLYLSVPVVGQFVDLLESCAANATSASASLKNYGASIFPAAVNQLPTGVTANSIYPVAEFDINQFYTLGQQTTYEATSGSLYTAVADFVTGKDPANLVQSAGFWTTTIDGATATLTTYLDTLNDRMTSDASQFAQIFLSSVGYQSQSNSVLADQAALRSLNATFDINTGGMNTVTTGSLNQFTSNLVATSQDMALLGQLISLQNLNDLGLPGELLAQIGRVSGGEIPTISSLLSAAGVSGTSISNTALGNNTLTNQEEEIAYKVMLAVTGDNLRQVLSILGVLQVGFTNMAQLLDPQKIFPNSFQYLTCPSTTALLTLYKGGGGTWAVNQSLRALFVGDPVNIYTGPNNVTGLDILSKITPPEVALANKSMARSLQQIAGITNSDLPGLARAMSLVETNAGLPLIEQATQPVPTGVANFLASNLGNGTGEGGSLKVSDICGSPSGLGLTEPFSQVVGNLQAIDFSSLTANSGSPSSGTNGIYTYMDYTLNTDAYVQDLGVSIDIVIPAGPAAGTYSGNTLVQAREAAMTSGLIPAATSALNTVVTNNNTAWANATNGWANVVAMMQRQVDNLSLAEIDINNLTANDRSSAMIFAELTHQWGVDQEPGGPNQMLELMAQTGNVSGQALIASLREGRNIKALGDAGISTVTQSL